MLRLLLIYLFLFLAALGLRFCARAFSSCGKRGPLFIAVRGPLTIAASVVAEHSLQTRRLSNCGSWARLLRSMWDLPRPGLEPMSPALAGGFFLSFFTYLPIYLFVAVLGLRFCARAFSSCSERGPLFIAVRGPLTVAASLIKEHRLRMRRLSGHGSQAQVLRGMWDLPRPGLEPVSPASAGGLSTTAPPGKPQNFRILWNDFN